MTSTDFVSLAAQIAVVLFVAVLLGRLFRAFGQPAVLGEMLGGVLLGPSLLGALVPGGLGRLFGSSPAASAALDSLTRLGMLFFLFAVGLETHLSRLRNSTRPVVALGLSGTLLPVAVGVALVSLAPSGFWGPGAAAFPVVFALFVGLNLANSALPVLARTLSDLGYLDSRVGATCLAAAIVDDLVTWTCAALLLRQLGAAGAPALPAAAQLGLVAFVAVACWQGPRLLRYVAGHFAGAPALVAATAALLLAVSGATEALGTHAFLGAFLFGVALGRGEGEHAQARDAIVRFASGFFAPLYFVSLGRGTDFVAGLDAALVALVLVAAVASKLGGVLLGARLGGLRVDRETWAMAFGLNARGATGLVLAAVGREAGLFDDRVFVALAAMALLTSLMAGPVMRRLLKDRPPAADGRAREGSEAYSDL